MKWLDVLKLIVPAVIGLVPGASKFAPIITAAAAIAEETQLPGAEKRVVFIDSVKKLANASNQMGQLHGHSEIIPVDDAVSVADGSIDTIINTTKLIKTVKDDLQDSPAK